MTQKLVMQRIMLGEVDHDVKVTLIKGKGYGVRVFVNGELNQEDLAETRGDIGRVAREMLRMEDKCGNLSSFASAARSRISRKAYERSINQA